MNSKIRDNVLILDYMDYLGDDSPEEIDNTIKHLSKTYSIDADTAKEALKLSDEIMKWRTYSNMTPKVREYLDSKGRAKSAKENLEEAENKLLEILGKKEKISLNEFSIRYYHVLENQRGIDKNFDSFLDWLKSSVDYGIISSFCEFDEIYSLRSYFENEEITIDLVNSIWV